MRLSSGLDYNDITLDNPEFRSDATDRSDILENPEFSDYDPTDVSKAFGAQPEFASMRTYICQKYFYRMEVLT